MSDLAATNCGCGCDDNCGGIRRGFFDDCNGIILILILLSCCGNGFDNDRGGCGFGGDNSCLIIILLLLCCCGNGHGFC